MAIEAHEKDPLKGALIGYFGYVESIENGATDAYLLVLNGMGEPVEFNHTRAQRPSLIYWNDLELRRAMVRKLLVGLLGSLISSPRLLFVRADQIPAGILGRQIDLGGVPWVRVGDSPLTTDADQEQPLSFDLHFAVERSATAEDLEVLDLIRQTANQLEPFSRAERTLSELVARKAD
jgi:hypothetical protein